MRQYLYFLLALASSFSLIALVLNILSLSIWSLLFSCSAFSYKMLKVGGIYHAKLN